MEPSQPSNLGQVEPTPTPSADTGQQFAATNDKQIETCAYSAANKTVEESVSVESALELGEQPHRQDSTVMHAGSFLDCSAIGRIHQAGVAFAQCQGQGLHFWGIAKSKLNGPS